MHPPTHEKAHQKPEGRVAKSGYPRPEAVETTYDSIGVDTPEDLEQVRRLMSAPAQRARRP